MAEKQYNLKCDPALPTDDYDGMIQRMERLIEASLCANCRHLGDCTFLLRASDPIIECELHECGLSSRPRLTVVNRQAPEVNNDAFAEEAPLGLCGNCEYMRECMLPKNPSGVWHCEEYR